MLLLDQDDLDFIRLAAIKLEAGQQRDKLWDKQVVLDGTQFWK